MWNYIQKGIDYTFTGAHFLGRLALAIVLAVILGLSLSQFAYFLLAVLVYDILIGRVLTDFIERCARELGAAFNTFFTERRAKKS